MIFQKHFNSIASRLCDHKLKRNQGLIVTPFNDALGDSLHLNSWIKERMPEYIWLGLILMYYGRKNGFNIAGKLLLKLAARFNTLSHPKLSHFFSMNNEEQKEAYEIIIKFIDKRVLTPLTAIYKPRNYKVFNDFFNTSKIKVKEKIHVLYNAVKTFYNHQSNEATDLRYLSITFLFFNKLIKIPASTANTFYEYPMTDHSEEKMKSYRPTIRSTEMTFSSDLNNYSSNININFIDFFWRNISMKTECNPIEIIFKKSDENYDEFIMKCREIIKYLLLSFKDESINDDKFSVITGSLNYITKIFNEINNASIGDSIIGRLGFRTIVEVYIMLKYLIINEKKHKNIWLDYKLYGISKLKSTLIKSREIKLDKKAHFIQPLAEAIVNEIKSEEFIDIDLKYFDKQNIRDKFNSVDEKELYDIYYEYDSNYSHGFWSAIRESSLLFCNNPTHQYHSIADYNFCQRNSDVKFDCYKIIVKAFLLIKPIYKIPKSLFYDFDKHYK